MSKNLELCKRLSRRELPEGGFSLLPGGPSRPDAIAWAILAYTAGDCEERNLIRHRDALVSFQLPDGRVSLSPDHPGAYWPTPLAILAWRGSETHTQNLKRGVNFLISNRSMTIPKPDYSGHNTELNGWPWIEGTSPWVLPTAYAMMALTAIDLSDHVRVKEATAVLLDRQFKGGGWNYGNIAVFGNELSPMTAPTGIALAALKGHVAVEAVQPSISYAESEILKVRSPLSLGWLIIGLTLWGKRPPGIRQKILEVLSRQTALGPYKFDELAVLLVALSNPEALFWDS